MLPRRFCLAGLVACLAATLATAMASGQESTGEKVRFPTADGLEIQGTFYQASARNPPPPVVLLLHALGEHSQKKEWTTLAEELQKSGFSVLAFDFRGHGNSTAVEEPGKFWNNRHNQLYVKGIGSKTVDFKNFDKRYYPTLVNDIAAARAYLDRTKNDSGVCNTSNLILVGAEEGALLGAIWQNSEWYRFKLNPPVMFGLPPQPDTQSAGRDIICSIWLSLTNRIGGRQISMYPLLGVAARQEATPMVFMYSEGDKTGETIAKYCEKHLKVAKDEKYRFTTAFEIKGNSKLVGSAMLQPSLGTEKSIVDYLKQVVADKKNEWVERDYRKSQYVWRVSGALQFQPAKLINDVTPVFDTYERFIPR